MSRRRRLLVVATVAGLVVLADQLSKAWAQASLPPNRHLSVAGGWFGFGLMRNSGAAFSFLSGQNGLFSLITIALLVVIGTVLVRGLVADPLSLMALAAIFGGGLSNLLDRVRLAAVVDFIQVRFWPADFNLADVAIRAGAVVLVIAIGLGRLRRGKLGVKG